MPVWSTSTNATLAPLSTARLYNRHPTDVFPTPGGPHTHTTGARTSTSPSLPNGHRLASDLTVVEDSHGMVSPGETSRRSPSADPAAHYARAVVVPARRRAPGDECGDPTNVRRREIRSLPRCEGLAER
jgi:hypothetical protein